MENTIKVGSVVFHRNPHQRSWFAGPGTVTGIAFDDKIGVDIYTVFWQSAGESWDHTRASLVTLAEKEAMNG
jgi:hypothetical protein